MTHDRNHLTDQLRATERAEAAPWVRPDRGPAATAAVVGALVGAWVLSNALLEAPLWILAHLGFTLAPLAVLVSVWVAAPVAAVAAAGLFCVFDRAYAAASRRLVVRTGGGA